MTTTTITPQKPLFDLKIKEVWHYHNLLMLFVKRDIVIGYKQTIWGPLWFFIQPIFTTLTYLLVFWKIAGISTGGVPPILFYMGGITIWNYFSESLRLISNSFVGNVGLFGKVYFPRIIAPLSTVVSNLIRFGIQFAMFLAIYFYYFFTGSAINPNMTIVFFPAYIVIMAIMALGFGLIVSALTTKYRDLTFLIQFGIQLWMYITPVIYPLSQVPAEYKFIVMANPLSSVVEAFKYGFLSSGTFNASGIIYSIIFSIAVLFIGFVIFNRTEKTFMDTV
jgi:lipopolysaccharide transport system permease protein